MSFRLAVTGFLCLFCVSQSAAESPSGRRPNVLVILADDMGYSDAGCYGGDIATPNLDALAQRGLRFTQYYNTARCWPSRAAILTGYYAQQVRRDGFPQSRTDSAESSTRLAKSGPGGTRPIWAKLLPERLKTHGYRAFHSGKWHLDGMPLQNGFDHSYSLNDQDSHFASKRHTEDDLPLPPVQRDGGYYSSTAIAEHAIQFLKEHQTKYTSQPFFGYVAFTAPHFPLHALPEDVAKYRDHYVRGWDLMGEERWQRMRQFGVGGTSMSAIERGLGPPYAIPEALQKLGPDEVNLPLAWNELNAAQQQFQAAKMAIHAAMIDRMDREIGRILDKLRAMNELENTLLFFLSDNGASAEIIVRGEGHDPTAERGSAGSYLCLGPGWSSVANTPFRRHKTWVHEGGIATPLIVHWPQGFAARGELRHTPGHVIDLVPTILEATGAQDSTPQFDPVIPVLPGKSLVPLFAKDGNISRDCLWWLHEGNRALRVGDWKIVSTAHPGNWELYDLSTDRAESKNLALEMPQKLQDLADQWERLTLEMRALAEQD